MKKKLIFYYIAAVLVIVIGFFPFSKIHHSDRNFGEDSVSLDGDITKPEITYPAHDTIQIKWYGIKIYSDESGWKYHGSSGNWTREKRAHLGGIVITSIIIILLILAIPNYIFGLKVKNYIFGFMAKVKNYIFGFKAKVEKTKMKNKIAPKKEDTSVMVNELKAYRLLLDEGMITAEEYQRKKEELLKISSGDAQNITEEGIVKKSAEFLQSQTVEDVKNWSFENDSDSEKKNPSDFMD